VLQFDRIILSNLANQVKTCKTFQLNITGKILSRIKAGVANLANAFALQPALAVA